jgi:hypothetical protein
MGNLSDGTQRRALKETLCVCVYKRGERERERERERKRGRERKKEEERESQRTLFPSILCCAF